MSRPYSALRGIMTTNECDQPGLALIIDKSKEYVGLRMRAKYPWSQNDMYIILDYFKIQHDQMHVYFPKDGRPSPLV